MTIQLAQVTGRWMTTTPGDLTVTFEPELPEARSDGVMVALPSIVCTVNEAGDLVSPQGELGVKLFAGSYRVTIRGGSSTAHYSISVEAGQMFDLIVALVAEQR